MNEYMKMAISEASYGIKNSHGGPFGCVIVKDGKVVGKGHNCVLKNNDATAHGEILAIRDAGKTLGTFDLSGCALYTTGEPCLMCLTACIWANISKVYFGATIADNSRIGFKDGQIDDIFVGREKLKDFLCNIDRQECLQLFDQYNKLNMKKY